MSVCWSIILFVSHLVSQLVCQSIYQAVWWPVGWLISQLDSQGRSHFKKTEKNWDNVPRGGMSDASPYLKTCVTVKIWLHFMHINVISRLHATVPVPEGGGRE